jgi:hypothetical protein
MNSGNAVRNRASTSVPKTCVTASSSSARWRVRGKLKTCALLKSRSWLPWKERRNFNSPSSMRPGTSTWLIMRLPLSSQWSNSRRGMWGSSKSSASASHQTQRASRPSGQANSWRCVDRKRFSSQSRTMRKQSSTGRRPTGWRPTSGWAGSNCFKRSSSSRRGTLGSASRWPSPPYSSGSNVTVRNSSNTGSKMPRDS